MVKKMTKKKKVLEDHQRVGKKFIPPMKSRMDFTEIHYVQNLLPEISWIQYIIEDLGTREGVTTVIEFMRTRFSMQDGEKLPEVSLLSSYKSLSDIEWNILREQLEKKQLLAIITSALHPFVRAYPTDNPFKNLYTNAVGEVECQDVSLARKVINVLFDRRSRESSIVQVTIFFVNLDTGKLKITRDIKLPDLNSVFSDFDSEEAQRACAHARMNLNTANMFREPSTGDVWASYFWNRGRTLAPLETEFDIPKVNDSSQHPLQKFGVEFESYARTTLKELWEKLPVDIYQSEFYEVIGALLSRQCTLSVKITSDPALWDYHSGPLFLRAMTDCYITVAWILKDPLTRARQFMSYGLGQEKLHIEHLKAEHEELEAGEEKERLQQVIDIRTAWANSHRYTFLQEVDIGSWSGITTRKMAEEADCLSLYTFSYTPWSNAAHGSWNHVGRFDSKRSEDSLHKQIRQPYYFVHQEFDVVVNAVKYLDKLFVLVVSHFNLEMVNIPPYEWLMDKIVDLFNSIDVYQKPEEPSKC